ncbi:ABC transporter permease subunit [Alkalicoccus halolimnae]|uniref:ABC transporter permease subunit n=1 Tax=Alkalicoccus halolimnae TaxID=1667239 RepID=A0A5C7F9A0_9BACI|nr:ABC transporter permease subunit [Alkalicoccus halolimnae]TXF81975.1 ABC transporter permease subunit [Alkalicoccus halolimnae]
MAGLLQNELMKIFRRLGTKIMFILLISVIIIVGLIFRFGVGGPEQAGEDSLHSMEMEITQMQEEMESGNLSPQAAARLQEQQMLFDYYEEEQIEPIPDNHMWNLVIDNPQLVSFVTMFSIIIGAGITAGEHSNGTIKLLLIRPVKRWKILFSKWAATMIFALSMLLTLIFTSILTGGLLNGFSLSPFQIVEIVDGSVREMNILSYVGTAYTLAFGELLIMTTLAFTLGTVFRNQSLAVGLSLVLLFTGSQMVFLVSQYEWANFILFAHSNLLQHFIGQPILPDSTLAFSLVISILYFLLFKAAAYAVFIKRDVAD